MHLHDSIGIGPDPYAYWTPAQIYACGYLEAIQLCHCLDDYDSSREKVKSAFECIPIVFIYLFTLLAVLGTRANLLWKKAG